MSLAEHKQFSEKLAFHSAPTLLGIKCASLLSLSASELNLSQHSAAFNQRVASKGLKSRILCNCGKRTLLLVYSEKLLSQRLQDDDCRALLVECGYPSGFRLDADLDRLSERIRSGGDFPHEIGVFLGYPMEDVLGFIQNRGENYKICGFWKVYGCEEHAKRTFANYVKCRNFLCNKLNEGTDIYQALKVS